MSPYCVCVWYIMNVSEVFVIHTNIYTYINIYRKKVDILSKQSEVHLNPHHPHHISPPPPPPRRLRHRGRAGGRRRHHQPAVGRDVRGVTSPPTPSYSPPRCNKIIRMTIVHIRPCHSQGPNFNPCQIDILIQGDAAHIRHNTAMDT